MPHPHKHYSHRAPWLRAAVLGAMDGLGSIAALLLGVQGGAASRRAILLAGASGAVAGALSMGVSEYVSVASQRDAQRADVAAEAAALREAPADELAELRRIYVARGLDDDTAARVATQLSARDALTAHARDEVRACAPRECQERPCNGVRSEPALRLTALRAQLGLDVGALAQPMVAALAGSGSFAVGACAPLLAAAVARTDVQRAAACVALTTGGFLCAGAGAAALGGASMWVGAARLVLGGWLELAVTYAIGRGVGAALSAPPG